MLGLPGIGGSFHPDTTISILHEHCECWTWYCWSINRMAFNSRSTLFRLATKPFDDFHELHHHALGLAHHSTTYTLVNESIFSMNQISIWLAVKATKNHPPHRFWVSNPKYLEYTTASCIMDIKPKHLETQLPYSYKGFSNPSTLEYFTFQRMAHGAGATNTTKPTKCWASTALQYLTVAST